MENSEIKVIDHFIQVVFPFEFDIENPAKKARQLHDLLKTVTVKHAFDDLPLPESCQQLIEKTQQDLIWIEYDKESDRFPIKRGSFHPSIERILQGHKDACCTLKLEPNILSNLLHKSNSKLSLKVADVDKSIVDLFFAILDIRLVILDIGIGCITMKLKFDDIQTGKKLLAGVYALCRNDVSQDDRNAKIRWTARNDDKTIKSLADIIENIAPIFKLGLARRSPGMWRKTFSYCAVKIDLDSNELDSTHQLGFCLSRQYNDKYLPAKDIIISSVYQPFEQISHICSLEGGAIIIRAKNHGENNKIENFIKDDANSVYFPICLLSFIEYLSLVTLVGKQCNNKINFSKTTKSDFDHFSAIRKTIYNFKLNYRFSNISQISMRNDVHHMWRNALKVPELLEELSGDTAEIEGFISNSLEIEKQRSLKTIEILVFLGGGLIAVSELFDIKLYDFLIGGTTPSWVIYISLFFVALVAGLMLASSRK